MEDEKILRNWENSIQIRLLWNATSELCVQKKSADALSEEGGASTPTAPEGVRALIILSCIAMVSSASNDENNCELEQ